MQLAILILVALNLALTSLVAYGLSKVRDDQSVERSMLAWLWKRALLKDRTRGRPVE